MKVKDLIKLLTEYDMNADVSVQIKSGLGEFDKTEIFKCASNSHGVLIVPEAFLVDLNSHNWNIKEA